LIGFFQVLVRTTVTVDVATPVVAQTETKPVAKFATLSVALPATKPKHHF
jgi:hypothetical protein